jgi:hypothetical protein
MTSRRTAGRDRGRRVLPAVLLTLALGPTAAACEAAVPSSQPASTPPSASPAASGSGDGSAAPRTTPWPGNAALGIEALGAADGPIAAAINDFSQGIATEDLALMRRAAEGLAGLDVLLPNLDRISIYEPMVPFADRYRTAIRSISAAATSVMAAIDAGDAAGITNSSRELVDSLELYTAVQPELAQWVNDSIEQRRLLVR